MQPLHWAAGHGHADVVKLLVGAGAQLEATEEGARTALHYAAQRGHAPVVAELLSLGANPEARSARQVTALQMAASGGHTEAVARLAASGADLEASHDEPKLTALAAACALGHLEAALELLNAGASVAARDAAGRTPLKLARKGGHADIVAALVAAGAQPGGWRGLVATAKRLIRRNRTAKDEP